MNIVKVGSYKVGQGHPLMLMAGPCVLEGYERSLMIGQAVKKITDKLGIPYVFKASYDKANRSSYSSFRGPGLEEGLKILAQIKKDLNVPVVSDIHETAQVEKAAEVLDILQIPAFLCRQTDLVYAAAQTGRVVNIKKGQFLAPWDMKNVVKKAEEAGNHNIMLTERGASFGYNTLVTDMRGLAIMRELGYPVVRWLRTAYRSPVVRVLLPAVRANMCLIWPELPQRWASTHCSLRCTIILRKHCLTAQIWCA